MTTKFSIFPPKADQHLAGNFQFSKYFAIWWIASRAGLQIAFSNRFGASLFITAKLLRFLFFAIFLYLISEKTRALAGFTTNQVLFFFVTFNIVDLVSQMLFREVYRFRSQIVTGNFDLVLSRPVNPLFRSLLGGTDILDFVTFPPLLLLAFVLGANLSPSLGSVFGYLVFLINGLLISASLHIAVLALGIITTAVDHTIMIYRDITGLGRIPIDFYKEPVRSIATFVIPVGIMMTLPAKIFMGIFDWPILVYAFLFSGGCLILSLRFWGKALKNYSSASS